MCSCWRGHVCTHSSHSSGLLPIFSRTFPLESGKWAEFFIFKEKKMILKCLQFYLPLQDKCLGEQLCSVMQLLLQGFRALGEGAAPCRNLQFPAGKPWHTWKLFVSSAQLCGTSRWEFQLPFCWPVQAQERIPGTHKGLFSVLCLWAEVFLDFFSMGCGVCCFHSFQVI